MKKILLFILVTFLFISSSINAQYVENKNYLGPSIGFAWHGSTGEFGVNYEHSMDKNFTLGGILRFYSYDATVGINIWSYSYIFMHHFIGLRSYLVLFRKPRSSLSKS